MKHSSRDMLTMLANHYAPPPSKPPGGRLLEEIRAPIGLRRADALYLPTTTSGRGTIIGHEVKVNRSDVLAEVADPHKADAWMRYCNRWWLVISDASIIEGIPIPPEWGIMTPPTRNRFMTIVREAPKLTPNPLILVEAWGTIFSRVGFADVAATAEREHYKGQVEGFVEKVRELDREVRRLNEALGNDGANLHRANRLTIGSVLAEIERLGGYNKDAPDGLRTKAWAVRPEHVARGILAEVALDDRRDLDGEIQIAIGRAETVAADLRNVLKALHPEDAS